MRVPEAKGASVSLRTPGKYLSEALLMSNTFVRLFLYEGYLC